MASLCFLVSISFPPFSLFFFGEEKTLIQLSSSSFIFFPLLTWFLYSVPSNCKPPLNEFLNLLKTKAGGYQMLIPQYLLIY
jgi:hypothetical protein